MMPTTFYRCLFFRRKHKLLRSGELEFVVLGVIHIVFTKAKKHDQAIIQVELRNRYNSFACTPPTCTPQNIYQANISALYITNYIFEYHLFLSAGIGRTGTYIALDMLTNEGETEKAIDIPACVRKMRECRTNMIQNAVSRPMRNLLNTQYS